jgi:hypothetical protein
MNPKAVPSIAEPIAAPTEVIAVIRRHRDFVDLFRQMKDRLGFTNEFVDSAVGLTSGHTDKILGPSQCRNFGPAVFDAFCTLFALEFHVRLDLEAAQRMRAKWEVRKRPLLPGNNRVSKLLIARVLKANCKSANEARNRILSSEDRSKIARIASKARWRKRRNSTAV